MGVCAGATSCVSVSILRYLGPMSPYDLQVKKKSKSEVTIERNVRNKRKCITTVRGLENFNIKLADASKLFGKKFACGYAPSTPPLVFVVVTWVNPVPVSLTLEIHHRLYPMDTYLVSYIPCKTARLPFGVSLRSAYARLSHVETPVRLFLPPRCEFSRFLQS
jgi:hypothetical protein